MPFSAHFILDLLRENGFDYFSGVPCSYLKHLINAVIEDPRYHYVSATSEGEAVGLCCGAKLGGRQPVVLMQNSGLGNAVNPLTSLAYPFKIPLLLIVSWRGEPGKPDEPQHELMGRITHQLLGLMEIDHAVVPDDEQAFRDLLKKAASTLREKRSFALIVRSETIASKGELAAPAFPLSEDHATGGSICYLDHEPIMGRYEVLEQIVAATSSDVAIVATTGKTGRELFTIKDRPNQLYMVGSMGCASAVGAGLAKTTSRKVLVLDGDGAALMKAGNMATIGQEAPENLIHIILDNGTHDSTGGQKTASPNVDFVQLASSMGYRNGSECRTLSDVKTVMENALRSKGPHLIRCRIGPGSISPLGRPSVAPNVIAERFERNLVSI
ncbi:phosphonopyruvate decarboxylase [Roseibium sp. ROS1]